MAQQLRTSTLEQARGAYDQHAWSEAFTLLNAADLDQGLGVDDLTRLAYAAYWTGRLDCYLETMERAYRRSLEEGDIARAALAALMLQWDNRSKPAPAVASGWFARAERLLEDQPDCVAHGYLAQARLWKAMSDGDLDAALALADRMVELGTRLGDRDVHTLGLQRRGQVLVGRGDVAKGLALFEEAVVVAVSGELEAMSTAAIYCTAIASCRDLMEYGRAAEWSEVAQRWCEREASRGFPGLCRIYHAELIRLRGSWEQAEQLVRQACDELRDFGALAMAAMALYEVGEIRRRSGDLAGAEAAYCEALELGSDCQPGLALLRLAQGDLPAAAAAIADALADGDVTAGGVVSLHEPRGRLPRARLLCAQVEIALAAADLERAREAICELEEIATRYASTALHAEAVSARAALALADGGADLSAARTAHRLWQQLEMPYEAARARLLAAAAHRRAGNTDAAILQLQAAASTFDRLGARADHECALRELASAATASAASADGIRGDPAAIPNGARSTRASAATQVLTRRERDVLTLVAAGLTDPEIAERLILSPHTVHRHLANIRLKLDQPTRAAAVAHATRLGLL